MVAFCYFKNSFPAETETMIFYTVISNSALAPPVLLFLTKTLKYQGNALLASSVSLEPVIMFSSKSQPEYNI